MNFLKSPRRGRGQALFDSRLRLISPVVPDKKLDLPELWGPDLQECMRPLPWEAGTHSAARSLAQSKRSRLTFYLVLLHRGAGARGPPSATPPGLPAREAGLGEGPHVGGSHAQ